jgi:hypothetical protein
LLSDQLNFSKCSGLMDILIPTVARLRRLDVNTDSLTRRSNGADRESSRRTLAEPPTLLSGLVLPIAPTPTRTTFDCSSRRNRIKRRRRQALS